MTTITQQIIAALGLEPLPREGGFYRRTWQTPAASGILFLITPAEFSALHRLAQDELWHFHAGDPVEHVQLDPHTRLVKIVHLGSELLRGELPQVAVPAGIWQGARVTADRQGYALLGCTVAPPWAENGFELAQRNSLVAAFAAQQEIIAALTR